MKFSIITVCFNNRAGLEKTIKSVICQTYKDYEFIIIDGGSEDGTRELLEQYDDHIDFWCSEPDKGIYNAMNKGVTHAHGDYVIFMNSGDFFFNNDVLKKIAQIDTNADIIAGNVKRIGSEKPLHPHLKSIFEQLYHNTLNHQGSFINRNLLIEHPYEEEALKIVSDWKFWIETIIINNATLYRTDLFVAYQDMTGLSQDFNTLEKEREYVLDYYFPKTLRKELDSYYRLQNQPNIKNLTYIKEKSPFSYVLCRKFISFITHVVSFIYADKG